MLYKDLKETEDCSDCPLLKHEICPGGWACYGGNPVEPPCCSFDDDTDLDKWVSDYYARQRRWEEAEDRRIQKERERKEKNAVAQKRRMEAAWEVRAETREIKDLRNRIAKNEAAIHFAESMAFAINITNEMFRYDERVKVSDSPLLRENEEYRERIIELERIKKVKLAALRQNRKPAKEAP